MYLRSITAGKAGLSACSVMVIANMWEPATFPSIGLPVKPHRPRPENESLLMNAIAELTKNKTVIMIAHRLKTVQRVDQILVLANGHIVQKGAHEELVNQNGIYADFIGIRKKAIGYQLVSAGIDPLSQIKRPAKWNISLAMKLFKKSKSIYAKEIKRIAITRRKSENLRCLSAMRINVQDLKSLSHL